MKDYLSLAEKIFAGTKYEASGEDVKKLASNIALLEKKDLSNSIKGLSIVEGEFGPQLQNTILL